MGGVVAGRVGIEGVGVGVGGLEVGIRLELGALDAPELSLELEMDPPLEPQEPEME